MTIKEAKAARELLKHINPLSMILLPEEQQNAINLLRKSVEKKMKKYPRYFKYQSIKHNGTEKINNTGNTKANGSPEEGQGRNGV